MTNGFVEFTKKGIKISIAVNKIIAFTQQGEGTGIHMPKFVIVVDESYETVKALISVCVDNQRKAYYYSQN
jgi:hypothetical protein